MSSQSSPLRSPNRSYSRMDSMDSLESNPDHLNTSIDAALMAFANSCDNYAAKERQATKILSGSFEPKPQISLQSSLFSSVDLADQRHKSRPHQFLVLESKKVPVTNKAAKTLHLERVAQRVKQKASDVGFNFGNKYVESVPEPILPVQNIKNRKRKEEVEKSNAICTAQSLAHSNLVRTNVQQVKNINSEIARQQSMRSFGKNKQYETKKLIQNFRKVCK